MHNITVVHVDGGEGGIRTLAPVTPAYSLSRGAPYSHLGTSPQLYVKRLARFILAEREGFEPPVPCGITGFQDRLHKPLGHLSLFSFVIIAKRPGYVKYAGAVCGSISPSLLGNTTCKRGDSMNEKNNDRIEKIKNFLQDKGVYLVLLLCVAAIGLAAAAAYLPPRDQPQPAEELAESAEQVSHSKDQTLTALLTPSPSPTASPAPVADITPQPSPSPKASATPQREKVPAPVEGKLQWRFAVNELIYSRTLDQWMTHRGIDISAPKGTEVRCPWAGTVEEIYEDDSLGVTVKVAHSGGLCSLYSNLRSDCPVKEGALINTGTVIGYVGETAIAECSDPAHLHFELLKDGEPVNPEEYVIILGG